MNSKRWKVLSIILTLLLMIGVIAPSSNLVYAKNGQTKDIEKLLGNLSKKDRQALKQLEAKPGFTIQPGINVEGEEPVNVIVEFKQDPAKVAVAKAKWMKKSKAVSFSGAKSKVEASHQAFKQSLQKLDKSLLQKKTNKAETAISHEYRDAFNGVAITVPGKMVKDLAAIDVVERIWKNEDVKLELPKKQGKKIEPKMIDSVPQIGVDKLHEEGTKGKGIKVGVIDTGIDYNHPDLKGAYKGYKAKNGENAADVDPETVKGWDFIDNDADPMEATYDDWKDSGEPEFSLDGSSYYTSHGSHVSGTIAADKENDVDYAVKGVAPEADLYVYRVLGPYGSGPTDGVLAGIDKAVKDEMDVINLSLGMSVNDPLSPTSIAVNNAMLSNVVTVVSAGNAGPGEQTVGAPGAAALSISVAASDVSQTIPTFTAKILEEKLTDVALLGKNFTDNLADLKNKSFELVEAGIGAEADFNGKNLSGKIALIERGELTFDEKIKNAKAAGAEAVIVYNNEKGQIPSYLGEGTDYIPSFRISKKDGEKLTKAVSEGGTFTFEDLGNVKTVGDHLADFSSRGPVSQTYDIKPDVTAPGVAIFSTVPAYINDHEGRSYETAYARMQGTSMASPHVAGSAALILQENPDFTPFDVKAALMNTSVDLQEDYSVYEVGAGRINAYDAVHAKTSIKVLDQTEMMEEEDITTIDHETGSMSYGSHYSVDGKGVSASKDISIENGTKETKTYAVKTTFLPAKDKRQDAAKNDVQVDIPKSVEVSPDKNASLKASIHVPGTAEFGTYEGYIQIENANDSKEKYQVPFAVRVTDKGIDFVDLDRHAVPNDWTFHPFLIPFINATFQLSSPLESIDVIVRDVQTDEPIGLVGTLDSSHSEIGVPYFLLQAFMGDAFLFTDDPSHPVSDELTKLPEKDYKLQFLGHDKDGKDYSLDEVVVVDNTNPEVTFNDVEPGVVEVDESMYTDEDGYHALWVHTNVHDSTIDVLNQHGYDLDQSKNMVAYYQDSPFPGSLPVSENGEMKFGLLPEELEDGPVNLRLVAVDYASNANFDDPYEYNFVKKGTEYGQTTYDKEEVKLGDTVTLTLNVKNVKNLLAGEFELTFNNDLYKFMDVKPSKALADYAKEQGTTITVDEPAFTPGLYTDTVKLGAAFDDKDIKGLNGETDFLDVTFKVKNDTYYLENGMLDHNEIQEFTYQRSDSDRSVTIPVLEHDSYKFISKHSQIQGSVMAEAFVHPDGFPLPEDYEGMGVKVTATSPDGKTYKGVLDEGRANFSIDKLPVSKQPYELKIEAPGHLDVIQEVKVGKEKDGELFGNSVRVNQPTNEAGDVNGDGVIDIMDAMRLVAKYGKEDDQTDINKDGIVDETDVRFVEKNFMKVGPNVKKQPVEKLGKKDLNDLLKSIGLEPTN